MKSSLYKLQTDFAAAIRFKDEAATLALPINETNGISKETRLEVYSYGYWFRIGESIKEDFTRVYEKIGDDDDQTLRQFIIEARPGFHSLGDVSVAFAAFITQTRPDLKTEAALDLAVLTARMDAWSYKLEDHETRLLNPQELGEYEAEHVELLWNTSLIIVDNQLVVQKNHKAVILDLADYTSKLLKTRQSISTLATLLEKLEEFDFTAEESSSAIAYLTENEVLYFAKK